MILASLFLCVGAQVEAGKRKEFEVKESLDKFSNIRTYQGSKNLVKASKGPKIDVNIIKAVSEKSETPDYFLLLDQQEAGLFDSIVTISNRALITIDGHPTHRVSLGAYSVAGKSVRLTRSRQHLLFLNEEMLAEIQQAKRIAFEVEIYQQGKNRTLTFTVAGEALDNLRKVIAHKV